MTVQRSDVTVAERVDDELHLPTGRRDLPTVRPRPAATRSRTCPTGAGLGLPHRLDCGAADQARTLFVIRPRGRCRSDSRSLGVSPAQLPEGWGWNVMSDSLGKKRWNALLFLLPTVAGTAVASTVPTPGLEMHKQVAIGTAEMALCTRIYAIYFNEEIETSRIIELLPEAGFVIAAGGLGGYTAAKITQGALQEALNFVPVVGWGLSAVITGSVTAAVAVTWWVFCDKQYRQGLLPGERALGATA